MQDQSSHAIHHQLVCATTYEDHQERSYFTSYEFILITLSFSIC